MFADTRAVLELAADSGRIAPKLLDETSALACKHAVEGLQQAVHDNADNLVNVTMAFVG
jgi:hypothetical protein